MLENERSLDDLLRQVREIHRISKDIDEGVRDDLALLGGITRRTTGASRHLRILRGGVDGVRSTARVVKRYHLFIAVGFAVVLVLYMLLV